MRKGISPIIATVVLVAVTLVIAVAIVSWLMGIWGSFGVSPQVSIRNQIMFANGTLVMYVINDGSGADRFLRAELVVNGSSVATVDELNGLDGGEIPSGFRGWVTADFDYELEAGSKAVIKVYLESGTQSFDVFVLG